MPSPVGRPSLALLVAIVLYVSLPGALIVGPRWLIPTLEVVLIIPLTVVNPYRDNGETKPLRIFAIATIAVINVANIGSVALLVHYLLHGRQVVRHQARLLGGPGVADERDHLRPVVLELDRGGRPCGGRTRSETPTSSSPRWSPPIQVARWRPSFIDYLYTALTNATAFQPHRRDAAHPDVQEPHGAESLVSLVTVVVVAARAVTSCTRKGVFDATARGRRVASDPDETAHMAETYDTGMALLEAAADTLAGGGLGV